LGDLEMTQPTAQQERERIVAWLIERAEALAGTPATGLAVILLSQQIQSGKHWEDEG
jgi:hypothetical protein